MSNLINNSRSFLKRCCEISFVIWLAIVNTSCVAISTEVYTNDSTAISEPANWIYSLKAHDDTLVPVPFLWRTLLQKRTRDHAGEVGNAEFFYFAPDTQLKNIIHRALKNNPEVKQLELQWRATVEKVAQVTALPDPMFQVTKFIESVETRVGHQEYAFMFSQKIPFWGKLPLKGKIAYHESLANAWTYRAKQREIILKVKQTFYDLYFIKKAIEINNKETQLLQRIEQIARTYYSTGKGLQQDVIKIQTEITRLANQREILKQQQATLSLTLNSLMGNPTDSTIYEPADFELPEVELNLDELYSLGMTYRDELKSAYHIIKKHETAIKLARRDYLPDFTIGANLIKIGEREDLMETQIPPPDDGKDAVSVSLGINIPIWFGRTRAHIRETKYLKRAAEFNLEKIKETIELEIRDRYLKLTTDRELIQLYETSLIPQAEHSLQSSESAYASGKLTYLELLDSERTLLEVSQAFHRLQADYMKDLAELERAIGWAFPPAAKNFDKFEQKISSGGTEK